MIEIIKKVEEFVNNSFGISIEIGFMILSFTVMTLITVIWLIKGKRALKLFPDINEVNVLYRDKRASGYSTASFMIKMGGASKVLDIVVTDKELWLKSSMLFAGIGKKFDLSHRIQKDQIKNVDLDKSKLIVDFINSKEEKKQVVILTRNSKDFLNALNK